MIRVVSPAEYDDAARGRSGKQLLQDAPEDSGQTIYTLAHNLRGKILLGQLVLYIESRLVAVDAMTVHRPLAFNLSTVRHGESGRQLRCQQSPYRDWFPLDIQPRL